MTQIFSRPNITSLVYKSAVADNYIHLVANYQSGHHLQVCPTNMDPAYDKPPDNKYVCSCCQARGEHYRSLCPRNTDPNCIYQKRKAQGIRKSRNDQYNDYDSQREFDRMRRDRGHSSEYSQTSTPDRGSDARRRLREVESERARLVSEEITAVDQETLINLPAPKRVKRERVSSFASNSSASNIGPVAKKVQRTAREQDTDEVMFESKTAVAESFNEEVLYDERNDRSPDEISLGDDYSMESKSELARPSYSTSNLDFLQQFLFPMESDSDSDSEADFQRNRPVKVYSEFVLALMKRHPEMKEIVNEVKLRPTATGMMRRDSRRQREQAR